MVRFNVGKFSAQRGSLHDRIRLIRKQSYARSKSTNPAAQLALASSETATLQLVPPALPPVPPALSALASSETATLQLVPPALPPVPPALSALASSETATLQPVPPALPSCISASSTSPVVDNVPVEGSSNKRNRSAKGFQEVGPAEKRRRTNKAYEPILQLVESETTLQDKVEVLEAVARKAKGQAMVTSENTSLSVIESDAHRYRGILSAFKVAYSEKNDNQQLILLSVLESMTNYTNAQLNQLIGFCATGEEAPIVISDHHWRRVRRHSVVNGIGGIPDERPQFEESHTRLHTEELTKMVQFLTMPQHLQLFAYGVRHYMLHDGTMKTVNNCTRKLPGNELYESFVRQCEATGQRVPPRDQFRTALEATSGKGKDKLLTALDNVLVKDGIDNFKAMRIFIRDIAWTATMMTSLISLVDEVEVFMRTAFPQHLAENSTTGIHSFQFAFNSTPSGQDYEPLAPTTCCFECDKILMLSKELELLVVNAPEEKIEAPETRQSLLAFVREKLSFSLFTYLTHVIRATANKNRMDTILEQLGMDEIIVIMDWKMKLLMTVYRESMVEYFGKRGIPWMGIMLVRRKTETEVNKEIADRRNSRIGNANAASSQENNGHDGSTMDEQSFVRRFSVNFYDGLCDDGKEDSWASASHLQGALKHYKETHAPHITKAHMMTDGAGCFSGTEMLLLVPNMGAWTGIRLMHWFVSEAGCGKTPLDGHFCYGRSHAMQRVAAGKGAYNIYDAESAAICLCQGGGIDRTTTAEVILDRNGQFRAKPLKGIRSFQHRELVYDDQGVFDHYILRMQQCRGVGITKSKQELWKHLGKVNRVPQLIPTNGTNVKYAVHEINTNARPSMMILGEQDKGKKLTIRNATFAAKCEKTRQQVQSEEEKRQHRQVVCGAFFCPDPTCSAVYVKQAYLQKHVLAASQDSSKHWYGRSNAMKYSLRNGPTQRGGKDVVRDAIITVAEAALTDVSGVKLSAEAAQRCAEKVDRAQVPLHGAVKTSCVDGISHSFAATFSSGFAMKNALNIKATKTSKGKKFAFIEFIHGKGDPKVSGPNAVKLSPEQSAKLMPLVGTYEGERKFPSDSFMKANAHGQRLFQRIELLHASQIKQYMNKPHNDLVKMRCTWQESEGSQSFPAGADDSDSDSNVEIEEDDNQEGEDELF